MAGGLPAGTWDGVKGGISTGELVWGAEFFAAIGAFDVYTEGIGMAAPWGDEESVGLALLDLKDRVVEMSASGERERQRWLKAMAEVFAVIQ